MKVVEHKSAARQVLIGMATDKSVLGTIAERWDDEEGLFAGRWESLVGSWCVRYYRRYGKAPGRAVETYYDSWSARAKDRETVDMVGSFLESLSKEYERNGDKLNSPYVLDLAADLFNEVRATRTCEQVAANFQAGDRAKALKLMDGFRRIEMGNGSWISPLSDRQAFEDALTEANMEPVIELPGAIGNFYKHALVRDSFIGILGPEKSGKSFDALELAHWSVKQKRRTAVFECGDMSQGQVLQRMASRIAKRPIYGDKNNPVRIPVAIESGNPPSVTFEEELFPDDLSIEEAWEVVERFAGKVGEDTLRLSCHPNSSISARGIEEVIEGWARDGWVMDTLVVDYADILKALDGRAETRDQINATWKALRALSQRFHCLLVTPTQADTDSYDAKILTRANFSEDKRKNAHVTGMAGICQTPTEKDAGLSRRNWVERRNLDFSERQCLWVAPCLALSNPWVLSSF